jgi:hypothetical protein
MSDNNNNYTLTDIEVMANGIASDYKNTIIIEYDYDNTSFTLESDVNIHPVLATGEPEITYASNIISEFSFVKNIYDTTPTGSKILVDKVRITTLGEERVHFSLKNIGPVDTIIENIEFENAYIYYDNLINKPNKNETDLKNLEIIEKCISDHEKGMSRIDKKRFFLDNLKDSDKKQPINDILSYNIVKEDFNANNAFGLGEFFYQFSFNFFDVPRNTISGIPLLLKVTYRNKNTGIIKDTFIYNKVNFNLKYILGKQTLSTSQTEDVLKYIRPKTHNTI